MIEKGKQILAWFQRNERHLSTPLFIAGFINDVFTLRLVSFSYAVLLFGGYSVVAAFATIGSHYLHARADRTQEGSFLKTIRVLLELLAQFLTGGLLSGCFIFYTRTAALSASWPFIVLLGVIFVGNEFFRLYREELSFRVLLFLFTLYAYVIFALPTILHTINPQTFIESTLVTTAVFIVFLCALALSGWRRFLNSFREIIIGALAILVLVNVCYFTGIIPPLPLSLQDVGVYHSVVHTGEAYVVESEVAPRPWWDVFNLLPAQVHIVPGTPLFVYSSVFAPIAFTTPVVHTWELYDPTTHAWVLRAEIAFTIEGGRDGGYRGYSELSDLTPGKYRVTIETLSGQAIGRIYFDVTDVSQEPALVTESK